MKHDLTDLPSFCSEGAYYQGAYCGENGRVTHGFDGVAECEADAYLQALFADGFAVYTKNSIGRAVFYTLLKGGLQLRFAFYPTLYVLKLTLCRNDLLPPLAEEPFTRKVSPSITQLGRKGALQRAPGMSFAVQAADGSFVMIDGGGKEDDDCDTLFAFLKAHNPNEGEPVISYWMITHPHSDHMALSYRFLEKYGDEVELRGVAYNFPDFSFVTVPHEDIPCSVQPHIDRFRQVVCERFPKALTLVFHAGDTLYLPGLRMDFLYTPENYFPRTFSWVNHLSCAWMIRGEEKSALILGDCEKSLCLEMAHAYENALKCDILQLSHHGFNGACLPLYRLADPEICFWPCDRERFLNDPRNCGQAQNYEFNTYLRNPAIRQRTHYHSEEDHTVYL